MEHKQHGHNPIPRNYKLLVDPFIHKAQGKLYRYDGYLPNDPAGTVLLCKDPRSQIARIRVKPISDLPVPRYNRLILPDAQFLTDFFPSQSQRCPLRRSNPNRIDLETPIRLDIERVKSNHNRINFQINDKCQILQFEVMFAYNRIYDIFLLCERLNTTICIVAVLIRVSLRVAYLLCMCQIDICLHITVFTDYSCTQNGNLTRKRLLFLLESLNSCILTGISLKDISIS